MQGQYTNLNNCITFHRQVFCDILTIFPPPDGGGANPPLLQKLLMSSKKTTSTTTYDAWVLVQSTFSIFLNCYNIIYATQRNTCSNAAMCLGEMHKNHQKNPTNVIWESVSMSPDVHVCLEGIWRLGVHTALHRLYRGLDSKDFVGYSMNEWGRRLSWKWEQRRV